MKPSRASRSTFLAASCCPRSASTFFARSTSPPLSASALRQSMTGALVASRSAFTSAALGVYVFTMLACSVSLHSCSSLALRNRRDGLGTGLRFGWCLFVCLDSRLGFRATLDDRVRNFTRHELDGPNCIVVARNRIVDLVGVAIRVNDSDDWNLEFARFENGDALFTRIDDVQRVRQTRHVFDAAEEPLEARELIFELADFFLGQHFEEACVALALELAQPGNALLNRLKICQRATQPALVDIEHARAIRFLAHNLLRLLFC